MSCSDKLARWACLGLQGCLLSALMAGPLHLSTLVVAALPEVRAAGEGPEGLGGSKGPAAGEGSGGKGTGGTI